MIVQVKILSTIATEQYGTLSDGDTLRTNLEFAKYLVDQCKVAQFIDQAPNSIGEKVTKNRRSKK